MGENIDEEGKLRREVGIMQGEMITFNRIIQSMEKKLSSLETLDKFDAEERMAKRIAENCMKLLDEKQKKKAKGE